MMWQDMVLAAGGFLFSLFLIPSIRSKQKPSNLTCSTTALLLLVFSAVDITLNLWITSLSNLLSVAAWTILFFQKR